MRLIKYECKIVFSRGDDIRATNPFPVELPCILGPGERLPGAHVSTCLNAWLAVFPPAADMVEELMRLGFEVAFALRPDSGVDA